MGLMSQAKDRAKGESICRELKQLGLNPAWMEVAADRIVIGFEIISAHPNWLKAFHYDAAHATPQAFIDCMEEWKAKVRRDISDGSTSNIVLHMLANHGIDAVDKALRARPAH